MYTACIFRAEGCRFGNRLSYTEGCYGIQGEGVNERNPVRANRNKWTESGPYRGRNVLSAQIGYDMVRENGFFKRLTVVFRKEV
jgi:hypothetical protein